MVTGSIAAYKACEIIRLLRKEGANVQVMMSESAQKFIGKATFAALSGSEVLTKLFPNTPKAGLEHIQNAIELDAIIVLPATANIICKAANGVADEIISTTLSICEQPTLFAPAMNFRMWQNPTTQEAIEKLKERGKYVLNPEEGLLASLHEGEGRLPNIKKIMNGIRSLFEMPTPLEGKKVLITAGPTRESIDPVRFISNNSSGRQGYEIANSLAKFGVETTLISGPSTLKKPVNVKTIKVETADQMYMETKKALPVDIAVCTAAVSDFKPVKYETKKIKKNTINLNFKRNIDILEFLSKNNSQRPRLVIGFAAETNDILKFAREKKNKKYCDWIIANDVSNSEIGFNSEYNAVSIIYDNKVEKIEKNLKSYIANKIVRKIINNFVQ